MFNKPVHKSILIDKDYFISDQSHVLRLLDALRDMDGIAFEYIHNDNVQIIWNCDTDNIWLMNITDFLEVINYYSVFEFYIKQTRKFYLDVVFTKKLNPKYGKLWNAV